MSSQMQAGSSEDIAVELALTTTNATLASILALTPALGYAVKMTVVGAVTYIGKAAAGTAQASALWQCQKIDETSGMIITWADGNVLYDNIATDLTLLSYS